MTHAIAIRAGVFIVLGSVQLVATALILSYSIRYEHSYCTAHRPYSLEPGPQVAGSVEAST